MGIFRDGCHVDIGLVETWLSAPRFQRYLSACEGDVALAVDLYEWNIALGHALLKDICLFEVALRNAYDRELRARWSGDNGWLFDEESPINCEIPRRSRRGEGFDANALNRRRILEVRERCLNHYGAASLEDHVVAALPLGFWAHMTDKAHERVLWIPYLHYVWPQGTNRARLDADIRTINECRNRVAHHEHLFNPRNPKLLPMHVESLTLGLLRDLLPEVDSKAWSDKAPVKGFLEGNPQPVAPRVSLEC